MRKFVSILLLMGAFGYGLAQPITVNPFWFGHVPSAHHLTYWFDDDAGSTHSLPLTTARLQVDGSELCVGVHTIHCCAVDSAGAAYPAISAMFFRPLRMDSATMRAAVYWFDQDYESRHTISPQAGPRILDVSELPVGVHTFHIYAVGSDNTVYPTVSTMFFRPMEQDSSTVGGVVYWFDQDIDNSVTTQAMPQMANTQGLSIGVHTLHSYLVDRTGEAYPASSAMFFRVPTVSEEGISHYLYWLNDDTAHTTMVDVSPVTSPSQWTDLVLVDTMPFRSSYFHFELDTFHQPHVFSRNTFNTLLMDNLGNFVKGEGKPFIDYRVSRPVVSDTILPNVPEAFPKVTNNSIRWFRLTANANDSLAFRSSHSCTLELFDPTGAEVYHASADTATHYGGTVAGYDGTYYLAVHDATGTGNMNVTYYRPQYRFDEIIACDTLMWYGNQYAATGTYTHRVEGAHYGSDSVYVINLTINNSSFSTETQTSCDSYLWHGQSYLTSTTAADTLTNVMGCDSVVTLHLTLNYSSTGSETVTACDSYSWHGQSYMASTTAFDTLTNAVSCDSIVTLNLTLNYSDAVTETIAACDSYSWHGQSYTASATDVDTLANAAGCDSVVTLHLTINYSSTGIDLQTACDSLLWHGNVYTSSTDTPTFTMQSSAGCDSVVTLHLTLHNATRNELELADCDSIVWSEMTFYSSGDTCVILTNSAGCDSLNMLHLSVGHSERDTIVDTAVGSYEWNGTTYTESGEYLFSSQTEAGCDSIITLILTITQTEGILPRDMEQATLYPNPTTGKITIDGVKAVRIEVYDLDGRMLVTFSNTNSFDISKLPSGTYFIRIFSPQGEARQRVIKY